MKNKKSVLGRGLASILTNPQTDITSNQEDKKNIVGNISKIKISDITTNPFQPRNKFYDEKLQELAASIKQLGIIQPITVRKLGYNKYQLISGERRVKASKLANKEEIPAFIRIANDQEMLEMALIENIQRSNLNPIEVALSYQRLIQECKITQEQCSMRIGKKRSTIANYLGLLKLPEEVQVALQSNTVSVGLARALINVKDKEKQLSIFYDAINNGFSVREVEQIVKEFKEISYKRTSRRKRSSSTHKNLRFSSQQMIYDLGKHLDREVKIKINKKGKGTLIIPFNSEKDLSQLIDTVNNKP